MQNGFTEVVVGRVAPIVRHVSVHQTGLNCDEHPYEVAVEWFKFCYWRTKHATAGPTMTGRIVTEKETQCPNLPEGGMRNYKMPVA